jgi:hypothetical protein
MKARWMVLVCVGLCLAFVQAEAGAVGPVDVISECSGEIGQGDCGYDFGISIAPSWPTVHDAIQVTAGGWWLHLPAPWYECYQVVGDVIEMHFIYDYPQIVLPVVAPWGETVDVGPLAPGRYEVRAYVNSFCCGSRSFIVFEELRLVYLPAAVKQE